MTALVLFKGIGALCIVFCGWSIGNQKVVTLRKKAAACSDLLHLLELLSANFSYVKDALPLFFEKISETEFATLTFPGSTDDFAGWKNDFVATSGLHGLLSAEELAAFSDYWQALGGSGPEEELDRLAFYREKLRYTLAQTEEKAKSCGRMYRNLGASLAAILAVLLL